MSIYKLDEKIKNLSRIKGLSIRQLCLKIDMTESGLNRALKNNSVKIDTIQRIADVFEVPIQYFFSDTDEMPNFYLLPKEEREKLEREQGNEIDLNSKINQLLKQINFLHDSTVGLEELRDLGIEIEDKAKNGFGLVYLEYDLIRGKFKSIYRELKRPFKESEINHVEDMMGEISDTFDYDEKVSKKKK